MLRIAAFKTGVGPNIALSILPAATNLPFWFFRLCMFPVRRALACSQMMNLAFIDVIFATDCLKTILTNIKRFAMATIALFPEFEQTHWALVLCHSE